MKYKAFTLAKNICIGWGCILGMVLYTLIAKLLSLRVSKP